MKLGLVFEDSDITQLVEVMRAMGCEVVATPMGAYPPRAKTVGLRSYRSLDHLWQWADAVAVLEFVQLDINELLQGSKVPEYLIIGSERLTYDLELVREQILAERIKGFAVDFLPWTFDTEAAYQDPQRLLAPIINLPNVMITPELSVLSTEAMHRNAEYIFETLMDLELQGAMS